MNRWFWLFFCSLILFCGCDQSKKVTTNKPVYESFESKILYQRKDIAVPKGKIVYCNDKDIYVADELGKNKVKITNTGDCSLPVWAPDGDAIAYIRSAERDYPQWSEAWVVKFDFYNKPEKAYKLVPDRNVAALRWSPNDDQIAFAVIKDDSCPEGFLYGNASIYIVETDGTEKKKVADCYLKEDFAWSGDGSGIIYSDGEDNPKLMFLDLAENSSKPKIIYQRKHENQFLQGFKYLHAIKDGIFFVENPYDLEKGTSGGYRIIRLDADTHKPTIIKENPDTDVWHFQMILPNDDVYWISNYGSNIPSRDRLCWQDETILSREPLGDFSFWVEERI